MTVHPAEVFIFLNTIAGDVFGAHIVLAASTVVVGHDLDHLPPVGLDLEIRCNLSVVRQFAVNCVIGLADGGIFLKTVVFPHRNRTLHQFTHRRPCHLIDIGGSMHLPADIEARHIPAPKILASFETNVAFR